MGKPFHLEFAKLELSKTHMNETYYDKLQPYFGKKNVRLQNMDTDSFLLSINTKYIIKNLKNMQDFFDSSNLKENHEPFSNKKEKVLGIFKIETTRNIWIDEFVCLITKVYSFKCKDDNEKKLKGISKSQSKHFEFEEYKKFLDGEKNEKERDSYFLKSFDHEMYLQKTKKSTISLFDDKRYDINETESER